MIIAKTENKKTSVDFKGNDFEELLNDTIEMMYGLVKQVAEYKKHPIGLETALLFGLLAKDLEERENNYETIVVDGSTIRRAKHDKDNS